MASCHTVGMWVLGGWQEGGCKTEWAAGGGGRPVKPIISLTHWWDYSELVREGKKGDQKEEVLIKVLCSQWVLPSDTAGGTFLDWGLRPEVEADSLMTRGERDTWRTHRKLAKPPPLPGRFRWLWAPVTLTAASVLSDELLFRLVALGDH